MDNINSSFPLLFVSLLIVCRHIEGTEVSKGKGKFMNPTRSCLQRTLANLEETKAMITDRIFRDKSLPLRQKNYLMLSYQTEQGREHSVGNCLVVWHKCNVPEKLWRSLNLPLLLNNQTDTQTINIWEANHRGTRIRKKVRLQKLNWSNLSLPCLSAGKMVEKLRIFVFCVDFVCFPSRKRAFGIRFKITHLAETKLLWSF